MYRYLLSNELLSVSVAVGAPCVSADSRSFLVGHKYEVCECGCVCLFQIKTKIVGKSIKNKKCR